MGATAPAPEEAAPTRGVTVGRGASLAGVAISCCTLATTASTNRSISLDIPSETVTRSRAPDAASFAPASDHKVEVHVHALRSRRSRPILRRLVFARSATAAGLVLGLLAGCRAGGTSVFVPRRRTGPGADVEAGYPAGADVSEISLSAHAVTRTLHRVETTLGGIALSDDGRTPLHRDASQRPERSAVRRVCPALQAHRRALRCRSRRGDS